MRMEVVGQEGVEAGSEEERGCMSRVVVNLNATNSVAFISGGADRSLQWYNGGGGFDGSRILLTSVPRHPGDLFTLQRNKNGPLPPPELAPLAFVGNMGRDNPIPCVGWPLSTG